MSASRWLMPLCGLTLAGFVGGSTLAQPVPYQPQPAPPQPHAPAPRTQPSAPLVATPVAAPPQEAAPSVDEEAPPLENAPPPPIKTAPASDSSEKPAASTPNTEKPVAPLKRPRRNQAIIQALDKITAQTVRFPADINKPVRWKDLVFTVKACEESADDENQKGSFAYLEVYSEPRTTPGRQPPPARLAFRGWMFSEAPTVHPFEHPVYDVWLIACRTA